MQGTLEDFGKVLIPTTLKAAFHPVVYAKTLIQLNYEPLPPMEVTTLFGRKALQYPNIFQYIGHIKRTDGFLGMYRGLGPRLAEGLIGSLVQESVARHLKEHHEPKYEEIDGDNEAPSPVKKLLVTTTHEMIYRCAGVVVSYPFHVIMVRSMAQFVGGEDQYSNVFSAVSEIWSREGILGFFSGLLPRLLGEVITICLTNVTAHIINTYLIPKEQKAANIVNTTNMLCGQAVSFYTYPFVLVSNIMAANNTGLAVGEPPISQIYDSWWHCWSALSAQGELKRGSSILWRYYRGPTVTLADGRLIAAKAF